MAGAWARLAMCESAFNVLTAVKVTSAATWVVRTHAVAMTRIFFPGHMFYDDCSARKLTVIVLLFLSLLLTYSSQDKA